MNAITSASFDFVMKNTVGEHAICALKQVGILCQKGLEHRGESLNSAEMIAHSLMDCNAFAKTCLKVAFIGTVLTAFLPFLFGTLTSSLAFSALTCCVLTHDLAEIIERLSKMEQKKSSLVSQFENCQTVSARIEFMVKTTIFLGWIPTWMLEKGGVGMGFFPVPSEPT